MGQYKSNYGQKILSRNPIFMKKRKFIYILLLLSFFVSNRLLGQPWLRMTDPGSNLLEKVFILPNGVLAVGDIQGVNISNDNAATWTKTFGSYNVFNVIATDKLFAMGGYDSAFLYVSNETGTTWKNISNSEINRPYISLVAERSTNELFALAIEFGGYSPQLYKTTNLGISWEPASGTDCPYFKTLIAGTGANLYGLSYSGGLYRSTDDGATWIQINIDNKSNEFTSLAAAGTDTLYAGTSRKMLYQSSNKGLLWQPVANPFPDSSVLSYMVVSSSGALYVAACDSPSTTFYRSDNGGRNWTQIGSPFFSPTFYSMTVTKKGSIIARADYHIYTNDSSFIPLGDQMPKIAITSPAEGAIWTGGSQQSVNWESVNVTMGVFIGLSVDGGLNWEWLNGGSPVPNYGTYRFTVPNTPSTTCKIRMTTQTDWYYDWFNSGYFTIIRGADAVIDQSAEIPKSYALNQNYPNPFNPNTIISYSIPKPKFVSIKIYDVLGREIETLVNEERPGGTYKIQFNGSDLSSGIYYYRMQAGSFVETKKLILLK